MQVRRLGNTVYADAREHLHELFDQIARDLERIDPTGPELEKWRRYRTDQFIDRLDERLKAAIPAWEKEVRAGVAAAGRSQGQWAADTLIATLGKEVGEEVIKPTPITQNLVRTILNTHPFGGEGQQFLLSEWSESLSTATRKRIIKQVRTGMLFEESIPEITARLIGKEAGTRVNAAGQVVPRYVGGVYRTARRDAEAIVRTAVTYVSSEAHLQTFRANAHALLGVQYSATLDERTTEMCLALDGSIWRVDSEEIVVPGLHTHMGCRSTLVPVPDYEKFGLEPPPEGYRMARDLSGVSDADLAKKISTRRSEGLLGKSRRISSKTLAEEWLRGQPKRIQVKALGKGKAELFREGKISLKDLITDDLETVPLKDLVG